VLNRIGLRTLILALPCGLMISAALGPCSAAPLDKASCAKLAADMQNMKALDVDKLMENGPTWAVSHLSPADITLIRQYIDLDEQLKFRCSAPSSLVHLKHLEDEEGEEGAKPQTEAADTDNAKKPEASDNAAAAEKAPKKKSAVKPAAKPAANKSQANSGPR
jgi:hypothetical protein